MKAKHILGEKVNKNHSQAIPGMAELNTDQYYGTYKWSKDVAGHDGKKQTAPKGNGPSFKDAAVVGGISKTEHNMAKKAAKGKVTPITPEGSKEDKETNKKSPLSGNIKEARMSAAVKLQRAWEREKAKSDASRRRGEEVMAQAKKDAEKKSREQGLREFSFDDDGRDDGGEDPYKYPKPEHYSRAINYFGRFEADHFDKEDFNDATGEFKGYWDYDGKLRQIGYFKFDDPGRTGDDDPGMGWYYEPQNESLNEFAPSNDNSGSDGFDDETLKRMAAQWYNGDEDPRIEQTLAAAGWEIGQDEGYDDEPGVFVVQAGDVNGNSYMSWPAKELRESSLREFAPDNNGGSDHDDDMPMIILNYIHKTRPELFKQYGQSAVEEVVYDRDAMGYYRPDEIGKSDLEDLVMDVMDVLEDIYGDSGLAENIKTLKVNEMDSEGYTGSRERKSMSTYGSRDDYELGHGKEGKAKSLTAKQMMDRAYKEMMKSMSNAEKVDKGWRNPNMKNVKEGKVSEADAILRQIAQDEDWDMLYDVHKLMGKPTPEGLAGNIIDDMYQDAAIESGHHADDDFEEIYNIVLDRLIDEYGIDESAQLNEVDPRNYDSDIDYYNALRRQGRKPDIDDYDPPEPYDPYAEFEREEARRRAKAAKTEPKVEYSKEEGRAPNGKRYNMTVTFTSPDKHRASYAADRWMDLEWGAKTLIDKEQHDHNGDTTVKIYVQDNHKHGYWKPWKDEEPISKGLKFEDVTKGGGYAFDMPPKFVPRDTLGTDMSYHWGHGGGNKYGINSKLGPREDPRFGKRDDGKQGYRPEYQKPSEYDHGADRDRRNNSRTAEMETLLSKYGRLNSKLNRLERTNRGGANDASIRNIKRELETLERTIIDLGGQHHLRHYTESAQQANDLALLEQTFVTKFEHKYKRK